MCKKGYSSKNVRNVRPDITMLRKNSGSADFMSFPPNNSRWFTHRNPRTPAKPEAASYLEMGDLLPQRRPPRILVVDDQPSIAGLMSQLLGMRGYDVVTAANAEEAEAEVSRQVPDLI